MVQSDGPRKSRHGAQARLTSLDRRSALEPNDMAHAIIDLMESVMAMDILLLDISRLTTIADYFLIATGETDRQRRAIADHVTEQMREQHAIRPLAVEGGSSGWLLLDFGAVVVHLFSPEQRAFYRLEQLWGAAKTVVRIA